MFTRSEAKKEDAVRLGADEVIVSRNEVEMQKHGGTFDIYLETVSAQHDLNAYINQLGADGMLTLVGASGEPTPVATLGLLFGRRNLSGSIIGGIAETQEMLDFYSKHSITSEIELISIQQVNEAYERLEKSDVKYRFVINMASLKLE
ncbi:zinc-binding dehydrogenase [Aeoliella straminimaris]|uniref:zinc-binding dehydrogenase n=1 Tax=Aeoliella straminimaris TaxID=2954799 RepID=UPI00313464DC